MLREILGFIPVQTHSAAARACVRVCVRACGSGDGGLSSGLLPDDFPCSTISTSLMLKGSERENVGKRER